MSNHWHAVVYDPEGKLPRFCAWVHLMVAKVTNAFRGRWENMWAAEKYSAIPLHTLEDVIGEIAYTVLNPTEAGAVDHPDKWPGLLLSPHTGLETTHSAAKPNKFFRKKSRKIPGRSSLKLIKPPHAAHLTDEEYVTIQKRRRVRVLHVSSSLMGIQGQSE